MANRLRHALSPYLRQHADNPVDWHEWGSVAFAEARRRDVPVFLSVGYAACHWCHVMAHESFEDHEVARVLAEGYVSVKVDREERPDIDAVYMAATSALTGQGGWPMTCLLTPSAEPFFAGTYLTKDQLLGLLAHAGELWRTRREELEASGTAIAGRLAELGGNGAPAALPPAALDRAVTTLARGYDDVRGGFGRAPKFPPSMVLAFLARHTARTGSLEAAVMLDGTLTAMDRGGIYDQLAGGFARYSVDADWVVPHFEKMLYDNAQLARVYALRAAATGDGFAKRVALETAEFILRDLGTSEGGFAAALDADTVVDGRSVEGATYVWTPQQLAEVLGPQDGALAADLLVVTADGTFEHGTSTLQLPLDPPDPQWWRSAQQHLLAGRGDRPQPARDDKVVTSWAGLAIAALSDVGVLFDRPGLVTAATTCAELVLGTHVVDGRLRRASLGGVVSPAMAVLDDHGNLAEGLLALHQATGEVRWLHEAGALIDVAVEHFRDEDGTWYDTADDAETLLLRPRSDADNAEPSGQSAIAGALATYAAITGSTRHRELAAQAVAAGGSTAMRDPRFGGWTLAVAEMLAAGPVQVAVVTDHADSPAADELALVARSALAGRGVVIQGAPDAPGVPLLAQRPVPPHAAAAAYVCVGTTCTLPLTSPEDLRAGLTEL